MKKSISTWLSGIAAFGFAIGAMAAPYSVTFTGTSLTGQVFPAGVNNGEQVSIKFVIDNGNSSVASQAWSAANVQCAIFTFNNAQDKFVAINYSGQPFTTSTTGNFTTNGAGVLQAGLIVWRDLSRPITNPKVTNIVGTTSLWSWYINGANDVIYWNPFGTASVGTSNVANNVQVTNWSNPVPANGVCANLFQSSQPIPTLSDWGIIMLSALVGLFALVRLSGLFGVGRRKGV
jgi:hypothetical protein